MATQDFPELKEWMTPPDAGDLLGVSRQTIHKMILAKQFKSTHRVGARFLLLRRSEVMARAQAKGKVDVGQAS